MSLDDCEAFHRRALKLAQDVDYDYMEVSSPGADRPLKTERDFESALGQLVEAHFYRQLDGAKRLMGRLEAWTRRRSRWTWAARRAISRAPTFRSCGSRWTRPNWTARCLTRWRPMYWRLRSLTLAPVMTPIWTMEVMT